MIPKECKRLIEVDFPIKVVGDNSLAELAPRIKSIFGGLGVR